MQGQPEEAVMVAGESTSAQKAQSKENLLQQADGLRDIARRSRRLSEKMTLESDRRRLERHAEELDASAAGLEKQAVTARTVMFASPR
jgi:hypothetical protein